MLKVRWCGFDADEDTWEPMAQLDEDVEVLVGQCVKRVDNSDLTQQLRSHNTHRHRTHKCAHVP